MTDGGSRSGCCFYEDGRGAAAASTTGIELALQRILASPKFLFRAERDPGRRRRARRIASATSISRRGCRSSSGAASRTTSCSTVAAQGQLRRSGGARAAGPADAGRPARRRAGEQLRRPVAVPAEPAEPRPTRTNFPTSTTTCGRRFSARPSCSSTASCAKTATCSTC